jgi:Raf kinase inhibitor-like YbhB/YbcL family protein
MRLLSPAFNHESEIPSLYTCDGRDIMPPLAWSDVPPPTRSLALIIDDPDAPDPRAPRKTWVHFLAYNIPAAIASLPEGMICDQAPQGVLFGLNDFMRTEYGGPCPPVGRHRYFHKFYALDVLLPDLDRPVKAKLEHAMQGHILAQTELIGTYQRKRRLQA